MRSQYNPIIIVSTDKPENSRGTNSKNYIQFLESLELAGISFKRTLGMVEGFEKRSFILEDTLENRTLIHKTVVFYNLESYIAMDNEGHAFEFRGAAKKKLGAINVTLTPPLGDHMKILDTLQYVIFN